MIQKNYRETTVRFHMSEEELNLTNVIYILKFPNGKYYVGQTSNKNGLRYRISHHCYEPFKNKIKTHKDRIILKYKNFDVFILHKCNNLDELDFFEVFYINILSKKLINHETGGHKNKIVDLETRKKIREKLKEYNRKYHKYVPMEVYNLKGEKILEFENTNEAKTYFNISHRELWDKCKHHKIFNKKFQIKYKNDGYKIKDESNRLNNKGNLRQKNFYLKINGKRHDFMQFYKYNEKGEFIESVDVLSLDVKTINAIRESIHRNAFFNEVLWSVEKFDKIIPPKTRYKKVSQKLSYPIYQMDDDLNIIKEWENTRTAAEYYNTKTELIRQVCIRWRKHCHGFVWCYKKDYENYKKLWGTPLIRRRSDTKKGRKAMGLE